MYFTLLNENAKLPTRGSEYSAGYDLYATEDVFVEYQKTALIPTGVSIHIPNHLVAKIEDRSSMALKGLRTGAGVVDSDYYPGEIKVVMHNLTNRDHVQGRKVGYKINKGDKIAQILVYSVSMSEPREMSPQEKKSRNGGFGSTGN